MELAQKSTGVKVLLFTQKKNTQEYEKVMVNILT